METKPYCNLCAIADTSSPGSNVGGRRHRSGGSRVNSLPVVASSTTHPHLLSAELYRLRSFHITGNNRVVNCGDSFIPLTGSGTDHNNSSSPMSRSPKQSRSPARSANRSPIGGGSCCGSDVSSSCVDSEDDDQDDQDQQQHQIPPYHQSNKGYYRVVLLGAAKVGKSALVEQFMTSEYINTYDASLGMIRQFWQ